jgi:tetratricopeptide (TPR) repeat protein
LAEHCFSIVNEAHAALREPSAIAALNKLREGAAAGAPPPAEHDPAAARLAFRKGEPYFRVRDHRAADPHLKQAAALDPNTWPYIFYAIQSGYGAKRLSMAEAVAALDKIVILDPVREAELHVVAAMMFRANNNEAEAQARFKRALKLDPANRDALRDARLIASRGTQAATTPTLGERISGFFKRK